MDENTMTKKRLTVFLLITFLIAWAIFMLVPILGLTYGQGSSIIIVASAMFAPTLGNILTRLITKEGFRDLFLRPSFKGHVRQYLLVYFGPTLLIFLSAAVYFLFFPGSFDSSLSYVKHLAVVSGKTGLTDDYFRKTVLEQIGIIVLIGPVVNIIPTMGEEFGWRAYLLPKLRGFFSDRKALVITGIIWGLWHLPVIVMGHNYGKDYFGYPWLGILAMVLFCLWLGIIEGYISIKLRSAIPAAMIHSTVNAAAGLPLYFIKGSYVSLLGPSITGVIGAIPFIAVAVVLLIKAGKLSSETRIVPEAGRK